MEAMVSALILPVLIFVAISGRASLAEGSPILERPQNVFQVYQPVEFTPKGVNDCDTEVLLMYHVFAASYGQPFVGKSRPKFLHVN